MLKVVQEDGKSSDEAASAGGPLLDALVREGARQMLATALQSRSLRTSMRTPICSMPTGGGWWCETARTHRGR